jgi:hypothetical protein
MNTLNDNTAWLREHTWREWASDWHQIHLENAALSQETHAWLKWHAGERHHGWMLPHGQLLLIKDPFVAVQFVLEGRHHD